jgi:hypothetical protein
MSTPSYPSKVRAREVDQLTVEEREENLRERFKSSVEYLSLSGGEIAGLLGFSEATISRHRKEFRNISMRNRRVWETAQLFVEIIENTRRIFYAPRRGKLWHFTYSHELRACPIDLLHSATGLIDLHRYLAHWVEERKVSRYERFNYS